MNEKAPPLESRILYQSARFIIVNKLPGEAVGNAGPGIVRLSAELAALFGPDASVTAVNRLDVPVSGCVLFARTPDALAAANVLFREGAVEKRYLAIVETPEAAVRLPPGGELIHWLSEDSRRNKSAAFDEPGPGRKKAVLRFRVCGQGERYTLLAIELVTGRRHQIRAQLAAAGLHIKGDLKYGARRSERIGIRLHSRSISFRDPYGGDNDGLIRASAAPPVMDRLWQACWESDRDRELAATNR